MHVMKDIDIRRSLMEKLIHQNEGHDYRIISELSICDGVSRADMVVANGNLCGYEIKSDADTLERLPSQMLYYNQTFDKVFVVVGTKYANIISEYIPDWWGIYIASYDRHGNVILKQKKRGKVNKEINADALLKLLWRAELVELLKQYGVKSLSGKNRRILRRMAAEKIPLKDIRNFTREQLKNRTDWRE